MAVRSNNKISPNFNMSSMTDLVFLLLIFFIITSTLVTVNALDLQLPQSAANHVEKQTLSVSISKNFEYAINEDMVNHDVLEFSILDRLKDMEEQAMVLRAEVGVPIEKVVEVLDIAQRHRIKIVLATQPVYE